MLKTLKNRIDNTVLVHVDRLLKRPNSINGFQETTHSKIKRDKDFVHKPDDILGSVFKKELYEDVDLGSYLPEGEQQNIDFEKMHCVSESASNVHETNFNYLIALVNSGQAEKEIVEIVKVLRHFSIIKEDTCLIDTNYQAIGSGTTRRGNSQKRSANFTRHYGLVPKGTVPEMKTWNSHYYRKGVSINGNRLPKEALELGKKIAEYIDITYEWVTPWNFNKSYKYGTIQNSVTAPSPIKNGIYQRSSRSRNHAEMTYGVAQTYRKQFDSYEPFEKKYALNYNFGYGMLFSYKLKKELEPFNIEYIQDLKKKGWDYVLLVNDCGAYQQGVYKLLDDKIEKAKLKVMLDNGVKKLKADGKLEGINSDDFKKIINLV